MDDKDKNFFKKVLEDLESDGGEKHFGPESMDKLMRHMITYFDRMRERLETASDEERAEILDSFMEAKAEVDGYMRKLQEKTGLSSDELLEIVQDREGFSEEDWQTMQERRSDLKSIAGDITSSSKKRVAAIHKAANIPEPKKSKKTKKKKAHEKWMKSWKKKISNSHLRS